MESSRLPRDSRRFIEEETARRLNRFANSALIAFSIFSVPAVAASLTRASQTGWHVVMAVQIGLALVIWTTAILHERLPLRFKALVLILPTFVGGVGALLTYGLIGLGMLWLSLSCLYCFVLLGVRWGIAAALTSAGVIAVTGVGVHAGWIAFDFDFNVYAVAPSSWLNAFFSFGLLMAPVLTLIWRYVDELTRSTAELEIHREHLEELVQDRTAALEAANEALLGRTHDLHERVKELSCLYALSALIEKSMALPDILRGTVQLLPTGLRHPEIAGARIRLNGEEFTTAGYRETAWQLAREIVVYGQPAGSVEVSYLEEPPEGEVPAFSTEEEDLLSNIAGRLGKTVGRFQAEEALHTAKGAAETARLEEQERREEAERGRRVAEALGDVVTALNSNEPLDHVLDLIATQARQLLQGEAVAIYSLDPETATLAVRAAQGPDVRTLAGGDLPPGHEALAQAVALRQPVAVPDAAALAGPPCPGSYRALLAAPIFAGDRPYGGLVLYYGRPREFSGEDEGLATLFADQVALAVESAYLRMEAEAAAIANERSRLARELHDSVTQSLFSAAAMAEVLPQVWERDRDEARRGLATLRQLTQGALAEMRLLLLDLHPDRLAEQNLDVLLRQLTDGLMSRTQMPVTTTIMGECHVPTEVKLVLFRITQEALNNIVRHAQASQAGVSLECERGRVRLRVRDNGRGFDPTGVDPAHLGLGIMRERAQAIGAELRLDSQPGGGTTITVVWQPGVEAQDSTERPVEGEQG